jgi:plastocyanin
MIRRVFVVLFVPLLAFCGGSPLAPDEPAATVTISAAGISPKEVQVKAWTRVRFINSDARPHTIVSDPVDLHTQCPPLNNVGLMQPGESRDSGILNLPGTCGFHDHGDQVEAFRGRVVVR